MEVQQETYADLNIQQFLKEDDDNEVVEEIFLETDPFSVNRQFEKKHIHDGIYGPNVRFTDVPAYQHSPFQTPYETPYQFPAQLPKTPFEHVDPEDARAYAKIIEGAELDDLPEKAGVEARRLLTRQKMIRSAEDEIRYAEQGKEFIHTDGLEGGCPGWEAEEKEYERRIDVAKRIQGESAAGIIGILRA